MKKLLLLGLSLLMVTTMSFAQDRTISGKVTSTDDGSTLPGVNVVVKGTTQGGVTDMDGNFKITVPEDVGTLVFSFIGLETQEVLIGTRSVVDVQMDSDIQQLSEVVVTAFGVERNEKALGYAVQQVDGEAILNSGANNPVDALVGKAAGIQVTRSSGSVGGGSRIVIRGTTSFVGDNQPLIVIDGVRTNNETIGGNTAGTAQSNRLMDLNTEDIESMTVLKGAAATALYGTAGATGVILITTKKGSNNGRIDVNFSTQVAIDNITTTIDLQDEYAQGWGGAYDDPSTGSSTSWGPRISGLQYSKDPSHPNAPGANAFDNDGNYKYDNNGFLVESGGNGQAANVYDNVNSFFQTATSYTNALSVSGGGDKATFRFSASDLRANGVIPSEEYKRKTFKLASSIKVTDALTFTGSVNYTRSDYVRVQQGSNTSGLLLGMYRTPSTFDNSNGLGSDAVDNPSSYVFADGSQRNYRGGGGYDNPYWSVNNSLKTEGVDRMFGNIKIDYKFNKWAQLGLNVGQDVTTDIRKQSFEINSRTAPGGRVFNTEHNTRQTDAYFNFLGGGQLNNDFGINYLAGVNLFAFNAHSLQARGDNLGFPGFVHISNASTITATENNSIYRTLGFFAQGEVSWRNTLFLTLAVRNDYDSRLGVPGDDFDLSSTSFTYPSASLAFVFTELLDNTGPLTFGKLRASYAKVGAGPPVAYSTQSAYVSPSVGDGWADNINFPIAGVNGYDQSSTLGNSNLTPEFTTSMEFGLDLRFFEGRVGLDVAYYKRNTTDAILNASLPLSTGFANVWLNAGEMTSDGVEVTINAIPVQAGDFTWNTQVNYTKSKTIVDKLAPGIERLFIAGFSSAGTYLVAGNQYGAIFGGAYLRADAGGANDDGLNIPSGAVVINDDPTSSEYGYQAVDPIQRAIGDPNPDFIIGWNNTMTYKNFSLGFLLDWRQGGDLWNGTAWALSFFGRSQLTAETREEDPFVIDGVLSDGSPNNLPIVRDQNYWTSSLGGFGAVGEQFVQDGGWVRLREVSLNYRFPRNLFGQKFIRGGSIGVVGRNLWFTTKYDGIDPETSLTGTGNGQGFDYFNMPSTRSLIFKLSLDF